MHHRTAWSKAIYLYTACYCAVLEAGLLLRWFNLEPIALVEISTTTEGETVQLFSIHTFCALGVLNLFIYAIRALYRLHLRPFDLVLVQYAAQRQEVAASELKKMHMRGRRGSVDLLLQPSSTLDQINTKATRRTSVLRVG